MATAQEVTCERDIEDFRAMADISVTMVMWFTG